MINDPKVTSIVGPGGMTRSGQVFALKTIESLSKAKGKEVVINTPTPTQNIGSQEGFSSPKDATSQ